MLSLWPAAMEGMRWKNVGPEWEIICVFFDTTCDSQALVVTSHSRQAEYWMDGIPISDIEEPHHEVSYLRAVILTSPCAPVCDQFSSTCHSEKSILGQGDQWQNSQYTVQFWALLLRSKTHCGPRRLPPGKCV